MGGRCTCSECPRSSAGHRSHVKEGTQLCPLTPCLCCAPHTTQCHPPCWPVLGDTGHSTAAPPAARGSQSSGSSGQTSCEPEGTKLTSRIEHLSLKQPQPGSRRFFLAHLPVLPRKKKFVPESQLMPARNLETLNTDPKNTPVR